MVKQRLLSQPVIVMMPMGLSTPVLKKHAMEKTMIAMGHHIRIQKTQSQKMLVTAILHPMELYTPQRV